MSNFNKDALRKGTKAIDDALRDAEDRRNRSGKPFLPNIYWKNADDERTLLFLLPIEEVPEWDIHPFVDVNADMGEMVAARTEPSIGESVDPLTQTWSYKPRLTGLSIAVELEPEFETDESGREIPVGFQVATVDFTRRIRDDDGELTDDTEDVTAPKIGLVAQSPHNFYNQLRSVDAREVPIHLAALDIVRIGKSGSGSGVGYHIKAYEPRHAPVDRTNLLEYIENVGYVTEPDELLTAIDGLDDVEASQVIGEYLLYKRMDELADPEHYQEVFEAVDKPYKYAEKKKRNEKKERPTRPSRPSQRTRSKQQEEETETEEKPKTTRRSSRSKSTQLEERMAELHAIANA